MAALPCKRLQLRLNLLIPYHGTLLRPFFSVVITPPWNFPNSITQALFRVVTKLRMPPQSVKKTQRNQLNYFREFRCTIYGLKKLLGSKTFSITSARLRFLRRESGDLELRLNRQSEEVETMTVIVESKPNFGTDVVERRITAVTNACSIYPMTEVHFFRRKPKPECLDILRNLLCKCFG